MIKWLIPKRAGSPPMLCQRQSRGRLKYSRVKKTVSSLRLTNNNQKHNSNSWEKIKLQLNNNKSKNSAREHQKMINGIPKANYSEKFEFLMQVKYIYKKTPTPHGTSIKITVFSSINRYLKVDFLFPTASRFHMDFKLSGSYRPDVTGNLIRLNNEYICTFMR